MTYKCPRCGTLVDESINPCPECGEIFNWPKKPKPKRVYFEPVEVFPISFDKYVSDVPKKETVTDNIAEPNKEKTNTISSEANSSYTSNYNYDYTTSYNKRGGKYFIIFSIFFAIASIIFDVITIMDKVPKAKATELYDLYTNYPSIYIDDWKEKTAYYFKHYMLYKGYISLNIIFLFLLVLIFTTLLLSILLDKENFHRHFSIASAISFFIFLLFFTYAFYFNEYGNIMKWSVWCMLGSAQMVFLLNIIFNIKYLQYD